jgi:1-acyl-sn-glycerol-3-phosphate acyltransferase
MPAESSFTPKPRSEVNRPGLVRLAALTPGRKIFRKLIRWLSKAMVFLWARPVLKGLENIPKNGPALFVTNHLGDADLIVGLAYGPEEIESLGKIELYDIPVLGWILNTYGFIWIHRGQADKRALRAVLQAFKEGRMVVIAPEGRESLTGSLEQGTGGAAYLALKGDVPVIPVTFTGTENKIVFNNMKRFRKSNVSMTIGKPFRLERQEDRRMSIQVGTGKIMKTLAQQLPPKYRGVYSSE